MDIQTYKKIDTLKRLVESGQASTEQVQELQKIEEFERKLQE